jgi:type IVB pilus formation R64 PilN family outer membrane protein
MNNFKFSCAVLAVSVAASIAGCSVYRDKQNLDGYSADMMDQTTGRINDKLHTVSRDQKWAAQDVDLPFISGRARPISRDATLPPALRGTVNITAIFPNDGVADLTTLAQRLQDASGILVRVNSDALLPLEAFAPRLNDRANNSNPTPGLPAPVSASANPFFLDSPLPGGTVAKGAVSLRVDPSLPGQQSLPRVLDAIAARLGIYWKWDPDYSQIVLYRTETRVFEIRGAETNTDSSMSIGLTGAMGETGSSSLESKSKSTVEVPKAKGSQTDEIVTRLQQFMTRSGEVSNGVGGLIVVTDTKGALDQIQKYVEMENTIRSRTIDYVLEEITVETDKSHQAGTSWNVFFNSGNKGNQINMSGLNSLLEQGAAASLGATVGSGPWAGTSVAVEALSKVGKIVDMKTDSFGSNNGQPAIFARPERQKYVDKLEQTPSFSDNSRPTVSVTQAVEVSGRFVTVVPFAYSDGDVNLFFKYDNTPTPTFTKQTFPDGSYVQSPSSRGLVVARSAHVASGQPYVIAAQMASAKSYDERRVDGGAPMILGGSDIADTTERATILVLTAMVREK